MTFVHVSRRLMFWTDWLPRVSDQDAKIVRAYMDGTQAEIWVRKLTLWPNGLSVDVKSNKIFWCDAFHDIIAAVDMDDQSFMVRLLPLPPATEI